MNTRLNGQDTIPEIVDSVSNVLGEDLLIKQFYKEISLFRFRLVAETISSDQANEVAIQIFSISGSIARLLERSFVSDTIRSMGSEVKTLLDNVENWFNSLDPQSRNYVNSAVNSVKEISQYFLVCIKMPKSPQSDQILHNANLASCFQRSIEQLNEEFKEVHVIDTKETRQIQQRVPPTTKTPLTNQHPSYFKYGNMHPVDRALLAELQNQGYETEGISKEELDIIFGRALDGGLELLTGKTSAKNPYQVEDVAKDLLEELDKKKRRKLGEYIE